MFLEYLPYIVQLVIGALSIYWIHGDIEKKGIDSKFYWAWSIAILGAMIILGLIGILAVLLSYYLWSRYAYE